MFPYFHLNNLIYKLRQLFVAVLAQVLIINIMYPDIKGQYITIFNYLLMYSLEMEMLHHPRSDCQPFFWKSYLMLLMPLRSHLLPNDILKNTDFSLESIKYPTG